MDTTWDCIVVGGGAAGLSAALVLGRARRRTLVVDAGEQSNGVAQGIGGLLGHDQQPPASLYARGRQELTSYPSVEFRSGRVVGGERHEEGLTIELDDGGSERAHRLLLATGMDYRYPDLPGVAERWGRSVFHCPFCHGWEVREQPLGVLDGGASGAHRALLLRAWSDDVTLISNGPAGLDADDAQRLQAAGVPVDERRATGLVGREPELTAVTFEDGGERACGGLLVPVTLHQRSVLAERLGVESAEPGPLSAESVEVGPTFHTSVPGVLAAGDVQLGMPSVANAIAAGSTAAAAVVGDLMGLGAPGDSEPAQHGAGKGELEHEHRRHDSQPDPA